MNRLDREQIVQRLRQLPSLPSAVSELMQGFANDDIDVGRIVALVARDQGLTARILRVANSSFYGLQYKVATLNEAVVVLGIRAVRGMALALGLHSVLRIAACPEFDTRAYLRHGIACGVAARRLATFSRHNPELAFTAGLLHDIGRLVLASIFPQMFRAAIFRRSELDCPPIEAEREVLGLDHSEVGGLLAETWNFPDVLREALVAHHAPARMAPDSLANLIHVADATAHALALSGWHEESVMPLDETAWARLGCDWRVYAEVLPRIERDFAEAITTIMD